MEVSQSFEDVYGLGFKIQSFAVANPFIVEMNKACYRLGKQLQAFSLLCNDIQKSAGVLDLAQVNAMVNSSDTVMSEIAKYRAKVYENVYNTAIQFDLSLIHI